MVPGIFILETRIIFSTVKLNNTHRARVHLLLIKISIYTLLILGSIVSCTSITKFIDI